MSVAAYPVRVDATLDPGISRWMWLVKWLLAIPHFIVLGFLWVAFVVVSVLAFFAILFTGRYPQSLFEFNVGVLRWTWRVCYYAYGALATDRYPPFTLAEVPDYPAHLEVAYPEHLSRGLVLVKWWLLAIPHYLVVGFFIGSGTWAASRYTDRTDFVPGGLVGLLVLVAAIVLAVTGRYPRQIFDFVLGMNRWVLRVAAYAGLMTDQYPPFRLDMGGSEPAGALTVAAPTAAATEEPGVPAAPPPAPRRRGWTAGRITSLVIGSLLGLTSLAMIAGGGVATWATNTQRDADGYLTTHAHTVSTAGYAVTSDRIDLGPATDWVTPADLLGTIRIRATATGAGAVFIGVAPKDAVDSYLAGVSHQVVTGWSPFGTTYRQESGTAPKTAPVDATIWTAQSFGKGTQALTWEPSGGSWVIVVMNPQGGAGLSAAVDIGATVPDLAWLAVGLFVAGGLLLIVAAVLIAVPVARAAR